MGSLREMVCRPEAQVARLRERAMAERLKWRPVREEAAWTVGRLREEWEGYCGWRNEVGELGTRAAARAVVAPREGRWSAYLANAKDEATGGMRIVGEFECWHDGEGDSAR